MDQFTAVLDRLPPGPVSVPDLTRVSGAPYEGLRKAFDEGLISRKAQRGPAGSMMTRQDALLVLAAVAFAALAGIAFLTALRTLRNSGASVSGSAITIPLVGD